VAIVGWFLVIVGVLLMFGGLVFLSKSDDAIVGETVHPNKLSVTVQFAIDIVSGGTMIVCGVNILNGANWARWFYVGWCILNLVAGFIFVPNKMLLLAPILALFVQAIIITVLFLPAANEFFSPPEY
jgi:hypothetical protein